VADEKDSPSPLLAGRYLLGESFASGGMGTVHLGRAVGASGFSRVVAIKRLFPGFATDGSFRQMLLDEARFASRIRQPNVVPILDVVEAGRDLYVVMEYVHGLPLGAVLACAGQTPMPVEIAIAIAEAVLFGLHAAHEARAEDGTPLGIVHRDVSPQNILVGADGVPRLIDFGIAKAATRIQVTDPGVLKGKAGYMAPEQILHEPVSRLADVFSASVVLWEMLANRHLFPFDVGERARRAGERPAPPSQHGVGIDPALDAAVLRGLERDSARRFPTAEAMALELRRGRSVASAVEVSRWLATVAGDELELSEERVRMFEQSATSPAPDASNGLPAVTAMATSLPEYATTRAERPRRRGGRGWIVAIALGFAAIAGLLAFQLAPRRAAAPAAAGVESLVTALPAQAGAAPSASAAPPVPLAAVPLPAPAPASPSASSVTASKPPSSQGHPRRAPKAKCDPPYTLDADGFKHYDPRCF
jgi:serine/threonine protein kinase